MRYKFIDEGKKHEHTLDGKPLSGTTTVIKEVMPPMLSWYGSGKALEPMGWTNPNYDKEGLGLRLSDEFLGKELPELTESPEKWYQFLQRCYRNHDEYKKEKGDWGTKTHGEIEKAIKYAIKHDNGYLRVDRKYKSEAVERFATWARGKQMLHSEVHCYSEKLWIGGIIDLIYKENEEIFIGDIKTSKSIYESAFIQTGTYDYQQKENGLLDSKGNKISDSLEVVGYTVVNIPKEGGIKVKTYKGTQQLREFAPNIVQLYKVKQELKNILKNKY